MGWNREGAAEAVMGSWDCGRTRRSTGAWSPTAAEFDASRLVLMRNAGDELSGHVVFLLAFGCLLTGESKETTSASITVDAEPNKRAFPSRPAAPFAAGVPFPFPGAGRSAFPFPPLPFCPFAGMSN